MALDPLLIAPGVAVQPTPLLNGKRWSSSNLIRFKDGLLQKRGGCQRLSDDLIVGVCRGLHIFSDLQGFNYVGIGTNQRLEVYFAGSIYDITPIVAKRDILNPFSTVAGSPIVTVADASSTAIAGDWVRVDTMAYVGGIALQGLYQVVEVTAGGYTFNAGQNAASTVVAGGTTLTFTTAFASAVVTLNLGTYVFTNGQTILVWVSTSVGSVDLSGYYTATVTAGVATIVGPSIAGSAASATENGGLVRISYLLPSAIEGAAVSGGYGIGLYGTGPYGGATLIPTPYSLRQWSMDSWGEDLLASPSNGPIYIWQPPIGYDNPATVIPKAPDASVTMFVSSASRQIIALGCTDPITGDQDLMLVRWCSTDDYTDWTASATNSAGSFRLTKGSRIVGGTQGPNYVLIWTDTGLWLMQYTGYPYIYRFDQVGWGCGLMSMRAFAEIGPRYHWLGPKGFFVYDGQAVRPVRSPVWDQIFDNIDTNYVDAVHAGSNSYFNESEWFYPTTGSAGVCTQSVKLNVEAEEGEWDINPNFQRSAWHDAANSLAPIATDYVGYLQQHEMTNDLDGSAIVAMAQTGFFGINEGFDFTRIGRILPDFKLSDGATVYVEFDFVDYVNDDVRTFGPYTVTADTQYIQVDGRGRYMRVRVYSNGLGVWWRLGRCQIEQAPDGRN